MYANSQNVEQPTEPSASLLIILATYNELDNLPSLIARLRSMFAAATILVIDDDSPDGTGAWCQQYQTSDRQFQVQIRHGQRGLGSATRSGLEFGLSQNFRWLATMDADWSHDPEDLHRVVRAAQSGDPAIGVWIGSRYVSGGSVSGWPWARRRASQCVNWLGSRRLRLPVHDISSALRVYRSDALRRLEWFQLRRQGYGYLEELLCALHQAAIPMGEIPITFRRRRAGSSKLRWRDTWDVLQQIFFPGQR